MVEDHQENYITGWIKLFRSIRKHWIWDDPVKLRQWLDILLEVNHEEKKVSLGYSILDCKKGQSIMSLQSWAKRWLVSKSSARRFLEMLQRDKMIVMENVTKTTRITVCNYDTYQGNGHDGETMVKRSRTLTRIKELKNNTLTHKMRLKFQEYYLKEKGISYYYEAKDAKQLTFLISKFKKRAKDKNVELTDDLCLNYLESLLIHITAHKADIEKWIYENLSIPNLNSQYQQIIARGKKIKSNGHQEFVREVKPF